MTTPRRNRMEQEVREILSGTAGTPVVELRDRQASTNEAPQSARPTPVGTLVGYTTGIFGLGFSEGTTLRFTTQVSEETVRRVEIEQLKEEIKRLKERVTSLEAQLAAGEEVIVLRTIDREQARQEIRELFGTGVVLYYSDIARQLRLELPLVVELCMELQEEGEIEVDANSVRHG